MVIFHIVKQLNLPERILTGSYVLFSLWLVCSLAGLFTPWIILPSTLALVVLLIFFRDKGNGNLDKETNIYSRFFWLILLVPLLLLGWALLRGFHTGDAYAYWLPWAKELAISGMMPAWLDQIHMSYVSAGPVWPLVLGSLFTLLPVSEISVSFLPALFFVLGLLVLVAWIKEKGLSASWCAVAVLLVLFNSQTAFWSWNLLAESALFFSYTLFFYFFEKSLSTQAGPVPYNRTSVFFAMSFCFAVLVKFSSLLLLVPVAVVLLKNYKKINLRLISYVLLTATPLLVWLARNWMIYGNPVFPFLNGFFGGPYAELYSMTDPFLYWQAQYASVGSRAWFIISNLGMVYPLIVLGLIGFWISRFRVAYLITFASTVLASIFIIFSASSGMRYIWPYIGLFSVYACVALSKLENRWLRFVSLLLPILSILLIQPVNSTSAFISTLENALSILRGVAQWSHANWLMILIFCLPFVYFLSREKFAWQYTSVVFIITSLLHVRWIANKSFLNTWPFIIAACLIMFLLAVSKNIQNRRKLLLAVGGIYVFLLYFVNSYAQAMIFYRLNGWQWPHRGVLVQSEVLVPLINQYVAARDTILTLGGAEYYSWIEDRTALTFNSFGFAKRAGRVYEPEMTVQAVYELLQAAEVKAIVYNTDDTVSYPLAQPFIRILDSDQDHYDKFCVVGAQQCLWVMK